MRRTLLFGGLLALAAGLIWVAMQVPTGLPLIPINNTALGSPPPAATPNPNQPCEACVQATLAAAATQEKINLSALQAQATATADILRSQTLATTNAQDSTQGVALTQAKVEANALLAQAAATADILQAHTLATANAGAATQSAAQTHDKFNANALQAQVAATADTVRANTLATSNAAITTQSAAQTEVVLQQLRLQLTAGAATQNVNVAVAQQRVDDKVSGTATALANMAALPVQSNVTARPTPDALLWMWVGPLFLVVAFGLAFWGFTRWLARRPTGGPPPAPGAMSDPPPVILNNLPSMPSIDLPPIIMDHPPPTIMSVLPAHDELPQSGVEPTPPHYQLTKPDLRQVRGWLEEVKRKLVIQRKE